MGDTFGRAKVPKTRTLYSFTRIVYHLFAKNNKLAIAGNKCYFFNAYFVGRIRLPVRAWLRRKVSGDGVDRVSTTDYLPILV